MDVYIKMKAESVVELNKLFESAKKVKQFYEHKLDNYETQKKKPKQRKTKNI